MTRKRANGEGTIYKRADGRYEGAAVVPIVGGGRRRVRPPGQKARPFRPKRRTRSGVMVQSFRG
jgi:hypothetical protein